MTALFLFHCTVFRKLFPKCQNVHGAHFLSFSSFRYWCVVLLIFQCWKTVTFSISLLLCWGGEEREREELMHSFQGLLLKSIQSPRWDHHLPNSGCLNFLVPCQKNYAIFECWSNFADSSDKCIYYYLIFSLSFHA